MGVTRYNLLVQRRRPDPLRQADATRADNGHGLASEHIVEESETRLKTERGRLAGLPAETVQAVARSLFAESCVEMAAKYSLS